MDSVLLIISHDNFLHFCFCLCFSHWFKVGMAQLKISDDVNFHYDNSVLYSCLLHCQSNLIKAHPQSSDKH